MKRASQVIATVGVLLSLTAVARLVRDGIFDIEGLPGVMIVVIPIVLSALGLRFAISHRPGQLWLVVGILSIFILVTAFSLGPYFWPTTGSAFFAALLLQFARDSDGSSAHVETPHE